MDGFSQPVTSLVYLVDYTRVRSPFPNISKYACLLGKIVASGLRITVVETRGGKLSEQCTISVSFAVQLATMPNTLIIGGHGGVGQRLTQVLRNEIKPKFTVYSLIRSSSQSPTISSLGGEPIIQSLEDASVDELAKTIQTCNASSVIFTAGAGGGDPERTQNVDHHGAIKAMDATAQAGVRRFILVSALDVRDRENRPTPDWYDEEDKKRSDGLHKALAPYMQAKLQADRELVTRNAKRDLEYTIVRPGALTNDPGVGRVVAGKGGMGNPIPREDVARVVASCLANAGTSRLAFDVIGVGKGKNDLPIDEALEFVAKGKVDCFEGYY